MHCKKLKAGYVCRKAGFTLVEIIMAMAIFVIITGGVVIFAVFYLNSYSFSFTETQAVNQAQNGLTIMLREIREARMNETGAWPLSTLEDNQFGFFSDVTNDGRADLVRYFLDGAQLKKAVIEPTVDPIDYPATNEKIKIITEYVDNAGTPIFTYYNSNFPADMVNNPLSFDNRLLNTRYVEINLRINVDPQEVEPYELNSGVQLRNLKSSL